MAPPTSNDDCAPLQSFWIAGYEGADHCNSHGVPINTQQSTQHAQHAQADYALLRGFGISTVRESVGWRLTENNRRFDFSSLDSRLAAAQAEDIQIIWSLCHYGWPDDVSVFSEEWIERFANFCSHAAEYLAVWSGPTPVVNPINEISFMAWAVCESALVHPHTGGRAADSYALKRRLVQASMAGCDALWAVNPRTRILNVDPLVHTVAPQNQPELMVSAATYRNYQFQAWDMLGGLAEPQLGGSSKYLDIVGLNYYHLNQWEFGTGKPLYWHLQDPRRVRLSALLLEVAARYQRPLLLAETSHVGVGRGQWIGDIADELIRAQQSGLTMQGACLYPIIDRPDWDDAHRWHNSGLWDLDPLGNRLQRRLNVDYAQQFRAAQTRVGAAFSAGQTSPSGVALCPH
jgi:UDP-galactopyranose mutase